MTEAMKRLRALKERQSRERGRMAELSREDELTDETRSELDTIEKGTPDLERQIRAAQIAVTTRTTHRRSRPAPGMIRRCGSASSYGGRASLGRYLVAHMAGRAPDGAEAELQQAAGVEGIPLELWDVPETRTNGDGMEQRAITAAPPRSA